MGRTGEIHSILAAWVLEEKYFIGGTMRRSSKDIRLQLCFSVYPHSGIASSTLDTAWTTKC
jgi:hypothetical protein